MTNFTQNEDEQALKQARRLIELRNENFKKLTVPQKAAVHICGAAYATAASPRIVVTNGADTIGEVIDAVGRGLTRTYADLCGAFDTGALQAESYFSPELLAKLDAELGKAPSAPTATSGNGEKALGLC